MGYIFVPAITSGSVAWSARALGLLAFTIQASQGEWVQTPSGATNFFSSKHVFAMPFAFKDMQNALFNKIQPAQHVFYG